MEIILTEVDERFLEVLRENGDWMSRSEIGEAVGVPLSPYHIGRLERLIELDLVEKKYKVRGVVQKVYYYRAVK